MGYIIIPDSNVIKLVQENLPNTNDLKLYDKYNYEDTIKGNDRYLPYRQLWKNGDPINIQIWAKDISSITALIVDCNGVTIDTMTDNVLTGILLGEVVYDVHQFSIVADNTFEDFYIRLIFAEIETPSVNQKLISEPQTINNEVEKSLLLEYFNSYNKFNTLYKTPVNLNFTQKFYFRVEGNIYDAKPENNTKEYEDQTSNIVLVDAKPITVLKLAFGMDYGLPEWVGHKLNMIRSHDNKYIGGERFEFIDKIEKKSNYPYTRHGYTVACRKTINNNTVSFGTTSNPNLCTIPSNLVISSVTDGDFTATWQDGGLNGFGFAWELYLSTNLATPLQTGTTNNNTVNINNLVGGTTYIFKVMAVCFNGFSIPLQSGNITTTQTACAIPSGFTFFDITQNVAKFSFNVSPWNGMDFYYELFEAQTPGTPIRTGTIATPAGNVLTGLTSGTDYNLYVKSNCAGPSQSAFGGSIVTPHFTTLS